MKIISNRGIKYSIVNKNELYGEMRIDSQYYEPQYIQNQEKINKKNTKYIKEFMHSPQYGISIAMNEHNIGYKILKMDDINDILANDEKAKFADISNKSFAQFKLKQFDVLFNRVNSDEYVGKTGIYLLKGEHTFASYLVRLQSDKTYQNCYLSTFLNCKYGYNILQRVKRRAVNQANINAKELKNLKIPYPSVKFQEKIKELIIKANILKSTSISLFKESTDILLTELDLLKWKPETFEFNIGTIKFITDKTTNIINKKDAFLNHRLDSEYWKKYIYNLEYKIMNYANGWNYLGNICNIYNSNYKPNADNIYKYIELSNIGLFGNIINYKKDSGKNLPTRARRKVKNGQIIISSVEGSLESCALMAKKDDGAICSNGFHIIDSQNINSETLIVLFKSLPFQTLLKKGCSGTILTAINPKYFRKIIIPNIKDEIQTKIKDKINKMYEQQENSEKLLKIAKLSIELYIESSENKSFKFIESEIKKISANH